MRAKQMAELTAETAAKDVVGAMEAGIQNVGYLDHGNGTEEGLD